MALQLATAAAGVLRNNHYVRNPVTGLYERSTLIENASTNLMRGSNLWGNTTYWSQPPSITTAPVLPFFPGETGWSLTNDGTAGSAGRTQAANTFTGSPETFSVILERGTAAITDINFRDSTAGVNIAIARITWATGVATISSGVGTARAEKLADVGPNGGAVYRLSVTATGPAGNARNLVVYPTGTAAAAGTVIVHHAQFDPLPVATSPIITVGTTATRAVDSLPFNYPHPPQESTGYAKFIEGGTAILASSSFGLFGIGNGTGDRFGIWGSTSFAGGYRLELFRSGGSPSSCHVNNPVSVGDLVEMVWWIYADGSAQLAVSRNGGALVTGPRGPAVGLPASWGQPKAHIGGRSDSTTGFAAFLEKGGVKVARGIRTLDQMRALRRAA